MICFSVCGMGDLLGMLLFCYDFMLVFLFFVGVVWVGGGGGCCWLYIYIYICFIFIVTCRLLLLICLTVKKIELLHVIIVISFMVEGEGSKELEFIIQN